MTTCDTILLGAGILSGVAMYLSYKTGRFFGHDSGWGQCYESTRELLIERGYNDGYEDGYEAGHLNATNDERKARAEADLAFYDEGYSNGYAAAELIIKDASKPKRRVRKPYSTEITEE